jgi:hypothetical protein
MDERPGKHLTIRVRPKATETFQIEVEGLAGSYYLNLWAQAIQRSEQRRQLQAATPIGHSIRDFKEDNSAFRLCRHDRQLAAKFPRALSHTKDAKTPCTFF